MRAKVPSPTFGPKAIVRATTPRRTPTLMSISLAAAVRLALASTMDCLPAPELMMEPKDWKVDRLVFMLLLYTFSGDLCTVLRPSADRYGSVEWAIWHQALHRGEHHTFRAPRRQCDPTRCLPRRTAG